MKLRKFHRTDDYLKRHRVGFFLNLLLNIKKWISK